MKKIVLFIGLIVGMFCANAQSELDAYKYVIVKKQYAFQKSPDKYQLNSLAKFLLEKSDLIVLFDTDEFSDEVALNPCLALNVNIVDDSGMITTQLSVNFRDCKNKLIYTTVIGKSKIKLYKKAYHEALRKSLLVFKSYKHKYTGGALNLLKEAEKESATLKVATAVVSLSNTRENRKNIEDSRLSVLPLLGVFFNDKMTFEVKVLGANYELVHPEIGKIADVYKTSKENVFIVQWAGKKQPRLLIIEANDRLTIDGDSGVNSYKRRK
ncbi:MAG: hypothetical protein JKY08_04305 [Flavobacteriaceae bacterium]|nr:hypothetical protein [Flavobacteriaceae bacterium]